MTQHVPVVVLCMFYDVVFYAISFFDKRNLPKHCLVLLYGGRGRDEMLQETKMTNRDTFTLFTPLWYLLWSDH